MFYFTEKVVNLKAWELYLGNAFWTFFVGLVLIVIAKLLGLVGIQSSTVGSILDTTGQITHAENPATLLSRQTDPTPSYGYYGS